VFLSAVEVVNHDVSVSFLDGLRNGPSIGHEHGAMSQFAILDIKPEQKTFKNQIQRSPIGIKMSAAATATMSDANSSIGKYYASKIAELGEVRFLWTRPVPSWRCNAVVNHLIFSFLPVAFTFVDCTRTYIGLAAFESSSK
jgi:hypothetical protein